LDQKPVQRISKQFASRRVDCYFILYRTATFCKSVSTSETLLSSGNMPHLAPKLWNSLPDNVQGSDSLSQFKSRLKTHFLAKHSYNAYHNLILQLYQIKCTWLSLL